MGVFLASVLVSLATSAAKTLSQACVILWIDEPKTPSSLIK